MRNLKLVLQNEPAAIGTLVASILPVLMLLGLMPSLDDRQVAAIVVGDQRARRVRHPPDGAGRAAAPAPPPCGRRRAADDRRALGCAGVSRYGKRPSLIVHEEEPFNAETGPRRAGREPDDRDRRVLRARPRRRARARPGAWRLRVHGLVERELDALAGDAARGVPRARR